MAYHIYHFTIKCLNFVVLYRIAIDVQLLIWVYIIIRLASDPRHNRNKSYDSYNKVGKKRHFPIQYECNQNTESNLSKKSSTEPRYRINAGDVMSDIVEEDKNSYEDLEEITAENFDEVSRNDDDLFLSGVGDNDDENIISEDDERKI